MGLETGPLPSPLRIDYRWKLNRAVNIVDSDCPHTPYVWRTCPMPGLCTTLPPGRSHHRGYRLEKPVREETLLHCLPMVIEPNTGARRGRTRQWRGAALGCVLVALAVQSAAQQTPPGADADELHFEVASVKPNRSGDPGGGTGGTGERVDATNVPLLVLVMYAFDLQRYQVTGGPDWLETDRYDVRATAGRVVTFPERRRMLQSLLKDRFKLTSHRETRSVRGWELVTVRADRRLGPAMLPCEPSCTNRGSLVTGKWVSEGGTSSYIAVVLGSFLRAPVSDHTGVDGRYAFTVEWSLPDGQDATTPGANEAGLLNAVRDQLGLKLNAAQVSADVLVIDRAERPEPD